MNMFKKIEMRNAAKQVRQEYQRARRGVTDIDPAEVKKELAWLQAVQDWEVTDVKNIEELRMRLDLCPLGRGHWMDHCEEVNCFYEIEQQEQRAAQPA